MPPKRVPAENAHRCYLCKEYPTLTDAELAAALKEQG